MEDIVVVDETREEVNTELEMWMNIFESRGFKFKQIENRIYGM